MELIHRQLKNIRLLFGMLLFFWISGPAMAAPEILHPVTDHSDVFSDAQEYWLAQQLLMHEKKTGVQMAILTLQSTYPHPIEDYSMMVAENWQGGDPINDRGVLFILAVEDRRMRLELGIGMEEFITDSKAHAILDKIRSKLRRDEYANGAASVLSDVFKASKDETGAASVLNIPPGKAPRQFISKEDQDTGFIFNLDKLWFYTVLKYWAIFWSVLLGIHILVSVIFRNPYRNHKLHEWVIWPSHLANLILAGSVPWAMISASLSFHDAPFTGHNTIWTLMLPIFAFIGMEKIHLKRLNVLRRLARTCKCRKTMKKAEKFRDVRKHLTPGQLTEVRVNSKEYDLWTCVCGEFRIDSYLGKDPRSKCPKCEFRTFSFQYSKTVREASYSSLGLKQTAYACAHCGHTKITKTSLPQRTRVSSSGSNSGSNFESDYSGGYAGSDYSGGGGSFGGGGASSSW